MSRGPSTHNSLLITQNPFPNLPLVHGKQYDVRCAACVRIGNAYREIARGGDQRRRDRHNNPIRRNAAGIQCRRAEIDTRAGGEVRPRDHNRKGSSAGGDRRRRQTRNCRATAGNIFGNNERQLLGDTAARLPRLHTNEICPGTCDGHSCNQLLRTDNAARGWNKAGLTGAWRGDFNNRVQSEVIATQNDRRLIALRRSRTVVNQ